MSIAVDELVRRAYAWVEARPEQWDRWDMAEHVARGRDVVRALVDRVDELEVQIQEDRDAEGVRE